MQLIFLIFCFIIGQLFTLILKPIPKDVLLNIKLAMLYAIKREKTNNSSSRKFKL